MLNIQLQHLAATCLFLLISGTSIANAKITPGCDYAPHEIIIKLKHPGDAQAKAALANSVGGLQLDVYHGIQAEHWRIAVSVKEAVALLEADPRVEYAEPNYAIHLARTPNEPRFDEAWGRNNTGQTLGQANADVDAPEAWNITTGSRQVVVAVIDTGVDYRHPDLAANIWTNPGEIAGNGLDDDGNGFIDDTRGYDFGDLDNDPNDMLSHGTFIAGIIGGVGDNGIGVAGVNWQVSIMPIKLFSSTTMDTVGFISAAIPAIEYATANGADVMSNSWGGGGYNQAVAAAITNAYNAGIFFVCAVGNDGHDNDVTPFYPANYSVPNVIAVLATDHYDLSVATNNWGWMTSYGATTVDIGAPGQLVMSTIPGGGYYKSSGTSFATPYVAGALGLLRSRFPAISVDAGKAKLMNIGRDLLPDLAGKCVTGGRLNVFKLIADADSIPPATVIDLAAIATASNWVDLSWTAPGDDAMHGTATAYDVRWSTAPITDETTWSLASPATSIPQPAVSGSSETMRVQGLPAAQAVYLSLRARDEYGNVGGLSSALLVTTLGAAQLSVTPPRLDVSQPAGGTTTRSLVVTNAGQGILDFSIPGADYIRAAKTSLAAAGTGGPDLYGYRWTDSDAVGGPAYNWIEINSLGTAMPLPSGATSPFLGIGFPFTFYGNTFSTFTISADGWLSFTDNAYYWNTYPFPTATGTPRNAVAVFWAPLTTQYGGQIYYYNDGTRLIVEYDHVLNAANNGLLTMQIHLYPNGDIEYHYRDITSGGADGIIGIQNATGDDGLTVISNTRYVHNGLAVRLAKRTSWLQTSPSSGSIAAGASVTVDVIFDATGQCDPTASANLHIVSNDPTTPDTVLPVSMTTTGTTCGLRATPSSLWFNLGSTDSTRSAAMTLHNDSAAPLSFTIPMPHTYSKSGASVGGPDAYGYTWRDSDEPTGPAFQWIDISTTGVVLLGSGANASIGPVTYGFGFDFYGTVFDTCEVSSNGFLSFTSALPSPNNVSLPNATAPPNLIAPFWDDLNLDTPGSGDIYGAIVNGDLVVMYDAVMPTNSQLSGTGPFTFEVILSTSGQITYQYLTMTGLGNHHTVGIQDAAGARGLQMVYDGAYLHDNLAITIQPLPDWLSTGTTTGTIAAHSRVDVTVNVQRLFLAAGQHHGRVVIETNSPGTVPVSIPVTLVIGDVSGTDDSVLPRTVALRQNSPNPFNPATTIAYDAPADGHVSLKVYDVRGSLVRTLLNADRTAGRYTQIWRGHDNTGQQVPSGVYFYRLQAAEKTLTRRMTLVK